MAATLADEFMEDFTERMTKLAAGNDAKAAFARLSLLMPPDRLHTWLEDERKRGTDAQILHDAYGTVMGALLVNFMMSFENPALSAACVFQDMAGVSMAAVKGKLPSTGIMIEVSGKQTEVTLDAVYRERMEKLKGGPR